MKKKIIPLILLVTEIYVLYNNWIVKGTFWNSLEIKIATVFSILVLIFLLLIVFKPDIFSYFKEKDILYKSYQEFIKNKGGVAGTIMIFIIIYLALCAPFVAPFEPDVIDYANMNASPPSLTNPMGTDDFGRDILSRVIYGSRVALGVAFASVFLNAFIGISLGLIAGFYGGKVDNLVMRLVETWNSIPFILLALAIIAALGKDIINVIIAVGLTGLINFARITRSSVLSVKEKEYIKAAKALGSSDFRVIKKHILPNVVSPIIVIGTLRIGQAILLVASLSFLGLGVQPPLSSWGTMLKRGQEYLIQAPWISMFSGLAIIITVMSFNLLGDALRDALDPKQID
ncbi:MAG: ABC transporter permease [Halanaerobiales bacterium]|nr:ABC transporter permease [Halanaerobiales bacterium]